jgi:hypothetical protein
LGFWNLYKLRASKTELEGNFESYSPFENSSAEEEEFKERATKERKENLEESFYPKKNAIKLSFTPPSEHSSSKFKKLNENQDVPEELFLSNLRFEESKIKET